MKDKILGIFIFLILHSSCSRELKPEEIYFEDICSFCRMAISQVKFASEIVTSDGEVYKFDEIGCMIRFKDQAELPERTKFYVKDFYSGEWIDAEEAIFVRSSDVATPMNSGIVAFKTRENLNRFFREYGGEVFSYSQIDIKIQR